MTSVTTSRKQVAVALIEARATGDDAALRWVHPTRFVQHNLSVADGVEGLRSWYAGSAGAGRVRVARVFADGDFVFAHTEYDLGEPVVGFDVFRFDGDLITEHWDNLQAAVPATPSGHTMIDGATQARDPDRTEENKATIARFTSLMVAGDPAEFAAFYRGDDYLQHNAWFHDQLSGTLADLARWAAEGTTVTYLKVHRILGEGNFVLAMSECELSGAPTTFYDLWRLEDGKLAEHWDTIEPVLPIAQRRNANTKF